MGEIEFDLKKGARASLSALYSRIRELREKRARVVSEIARTEKEIEFSSKAQAGASHPAHKQKKEKRKWHDDYQHFVTGHGEAVVAGKNAKQNDELAAKHLSPADLFFHADIQGAPTTILKGGVKLLALSKEGDASASSSLKEAAQWAASFSSAWKVGAAAVDVYAVHPTQVSKHASGGYVGRGAFAIEGEREWFRTTPLALKIGVEGGEPALLPLCHFMKLEKELRLTPGTTDKETAAKEISALLSVKAQDVLSLLPGGKFSIKKV